MLTKALRILVVAIIVTPVLIVVGMWWNPRPGISIAIKLYDVVNGVPRDDTVLLNMPGIAIYVEIDALSPPIPGFGEPLKAVLKAIYKGIGDIYLPLDRIRAIVKGWTDLYIQRVGKPHLAENPGAQVFRGWSIVDVYENLVSGLILRIVIYNASNGRILVDVYDSLSYEPYLLAKGATLRYVIHVVKGFRKAVEIERQVLKGFIAPLPALKVVDLLDEDRDEIAKTLRSLGWRFIVDRKLIAYLGPENLTKGLPRSYFELVNGSLYVKPLMIMVNNASRGHPCRASRSSPAM